MGEQKWCMTKLVLLFGLIFCISQAGSAATVKMEMKKLEDQSRYARASNPARLLFSRTYPQSYRYESSQTDRDQSFSSLVKKEPDTYQSEHPFRGVIKLGSYQYPFVLDASDLKKSGYDRLYFDRNRNGDLADDTVVKAMDVPDNVNFGRGNANREFPRQEVTLKVEDQTYDYAFSMQVYSNPSMRVGPNQDSIYAYARVNAASYRHGKITLDGQEHTIALLDFNSNGRFDDDTILDEDISKQIGRLYPRPGDMFLVDPDTSNPNIGGYGVTDREERHHVSPMLAIDNAYYNVETTPSGDTLTLTPSQLATGSITNPNDGYAAVIYSDKGVIKVTGDKDKPVTVPEGDWRLLEYKIDRTTSDRSNTRSGRRRIPHTYVQASGTMQSPVVTVAKGKTVKLPFGPPYKPKVEARPYPPRNGEKRARLDLKLRGTGEEVCTSLMVNGDTPPKPSFVIATKDSEIVERGQFEYG